MVSLILILLGASLGLAFPDLLQMRQLSIPICGASKLCNKYIFVSNAEAGIPSTSNAATKLSQSRSNCGYVGVCKEFNATQQYVSTIGEHAFAKPSINDIRGPCPGLNAAANHAYIPRNGLLNIKQAVEGLYEAYGLEQQLAGFLAAFAVVISGDVDSETWSIGGPPRNQIESGDSFIEGISYSHGYFEGDASLTRCDAYVNDGDTSAASPTRFRYAYESGMTNNRYTLDEFARLYAQNTVRSIGQNAYYFVPFINTVFTPMWYNFAINLFSNHSAAEPAGYLDGSMLQEIFAMNGTYPKFHWIRGHERIPNNFYRRPNQNLYGTANVFGDLLVEYLAYPDTFRFGGNINGKNSYTGVNITNITYGAYSAQTILKGDNLPCLFLLNVQQVVPLEISSQGDGVALLNEYLPDYFQNLTCPQVSKYNTSFYSTYPGGQYHPTPPYNGPSNCGL